MREVARKQLRGDVLPEIAPEIALVRGDAMARMVVTQAPESYVSYVNAVIEVMP